MSPVRHRLHRFAAGLLFAVLSASAVPCGSQTITVRSDSARRVVAPSAKFAVPMLLDLSAAGGQSLASVTTGVTFGATRLTFDSVKTAGFGSLTTNTTGAASGSLTLSLFDGAGTTTSQTMATLWFTAS
ncbi:MAG: hypothetical protein H3C62_17410, partial [Gemmatimonadaceae bacterium]|nr:hypothetical protein [Gemmatimonadaceae bacterium]